MHACAFQRTAESEGRCGHGRGFTRARVWRGAHTRGCAHRARPHRMDGRYARSHPHPLPCLHPSSIRPSIRHPPSVPSFASAHPQRCSARTPFLRLTRGGSSRRVVMWPELDPMTTPERCVGGAILACLRSEVRLASRGHILIRGHIRGHIRAVDDRGRCCESPPPLSLSRCLRAL